MGQFTLIRSIVIHRPNFFVTAAAADEKDLTLGDALNAAAQTKDDLVGKLVGNGSNRIASCRILILVAQHLRGSDVLDVIERVLLRSVDDGNSQVSKWLHRSIGRGKSKG